MNVHSGDEMPVRPRTDRQMSPADAYFELELPQGADQARVRAAYRRLAFAHHPDRNPDGFARFKRITRAYRVLERKLRLDAEDDSAGTCSRCGAYAPLREALDRNRYCGECLVSVSGRYTLPAPAVVIATCGFAIVTLLLGAVLLAMFLATERGGYGWASLVASLAALASLAVTALTIGHAARPRRR